MDTQTLNNDMDGATDRADNVVAPDAKQAAPPAITKKNPAPAKSATPKSATPKASKPKATAPKATAPKATAEKSKAADNKAAAPVATDMDSAKGNDSNKKNGGSKSKGNAAKTAKGKSSSAEDNKTVTGSASPAAFYNHKAKSGVDSNEENDLKKVMVDTMKDILYAEKRLLKAFPKMAKNARHESLKSEMNAKRDESEAQIGKIEQAFEILGLKAQTIKCAAMDGLLEEANEHMDEYVKGAGRDAAIVISAQKVEHYGIASYGTLRTFAQNLGQKEISAIFQEIVNQKGAADKKLTQLAKTINTEALKAHKEGKA